MKSRKNLPAIETNGTYQIVKDEYDPNNCVHDGEYRPKGELLWEINFTEDHNLNNSPNS